MKWSPCVRSTCPARWVSCCERRCTRPFSGAAAATSCSARTSCCVIRTRSTSATTSSSTTTASSTRRGKPTPALRSAAASSSAATRSCRARTATFDVEDGANIGFNCELFSASRVRIGRDTLLAAYCYVIGGDHDFSDPATAGAGPGTALRRRGRRGRRVARGRRQGARRRHHREPRRHRRRCRGSRIGSRRFDRRRHPGAYRWSAGAAGRGRADVNDAACGRTKTARAAGLRSSRVGRIADARRQAAVRAG